MTIPRVIELESRINQARDAYYNKQPTISDKTFDILVDELKTLDPTNKAVISIGAPVVNSEWVKAKHQIPMGSLNKINTPDELTAWTKEKLDKSDSIFVIEKMDGLSIEVIYQDGKLIQGISRGDGQIGENITSNVIKMSGVLSTLLTKFNGSLRGEIIMKNSIHKKHFADKANPRNAASGISKRLDGEGVNYLDIIFYQAIGDVEFKTEMDQLQWLKDQKLNTPNYWLFKSPAEANIHWRDYQDVARSKLDYEIDGLVIHLNDMDRQLALGDKDMRPKGAIAFKFDNATAESTIKEINWFCGNSGRITPVAIIDPVILVGAKITNASLYNYSYITELGLDIGATVLVSRAGDIIPRIEEVIKGTGTIAKAPTHCPDCNSSLIVQGENIVCPNTSNCTAQMVGRVLNWIEDLNLLEWGTGLIEKLVQSGKVVDISDLYTLSVDDLVSLDRMGKKSAKKCYDILWANTELSLDVFLAGLSITNIGKSTIKMVMESGYDSLDKIVKMSKEDFEKVSGVGPIKAEFLFEGLKSNENLILKLLTNGIKIKEKNMGKLSGKSVCFTGAMVNKRSELEKMVTEAGGDVKSSVGKTLSYLIIADTNSMSSKAVSARKLGTVLISEDEFLEMLK